MGVTDACNVTGAPTVAFVGVLAETAPQVFSENFTATCRTAVGTGAIDSSTVAIVVNNAAGDRLLDVPATATQSGDWEGIVDVARLTPGPLTIRCYVEDADGQCGSTTASFGVDEGPVITVVSPALDTAVSGVLNVQFTVVPQPVFPNDTGAEVDEITLTVAGALIPAASITDLGNNSYQAVIDFNNTALYPVALGGTYFVEIAATNQRGETAEVNRSFVVDNVGPVITFISPSVAQLVGASFEVRVRIADPLGISGTPTITVGGDESDLIPIPGVPNEYLRAVDASGFSNTVRELTLTVIAQDRALNGRVQSRIVKLDSSEPLVSLQPGNVRYLRTGYTNCSVAANPVGSDSARDLQVLGTAAEFRARAEDRANIAFGDEGTAEFLANIDPAAGVSIYILDDTSMALLVDTDEDGVCDSINPAVDPEQGATANRAVVLGFVGVTPSGTPTNASPLSSGIQWGSTVDTTTDPAAPMCMPYDMHAAPNPICASSALSWVMASAYRSNVATIFAKPPVTPTACVGDSWDFQSNISEGWACVAARAVDRVGNVGVSPVLRSCFVSSAGSVACGGVPVGSYMPDGPSVPSCTDGCTPPPDLDTASGFNLIRLSSTY